MEATVATEDATRFDLKEEEAQLLHQASRLMSEALDHSRAHAITLTADGDSSARLEVPPETLKLLSRILTMLGTAKSFHIYPVDEEVTTKQAAQILNVSRPFLISLLEKGAMDFRLVGRHRRLLKKDVLDYAKTMRTNRSKRLDEMVKSSEQAGLYDL